MFLYIEFGVAGEMGPEDEQPVAKRGSNTRSPKKKNTH